MKHNLFIVYGDETFLIDEDLIKFKKQFVPEGMDSFACEVISDKNQTDINYLVNAIQTLPSFSPSRLVVIKDFPYLNKKSLEGGEEEIFLEALQNIPEGVVVLFVTYGNVDKRKRLTKAISKIGLLREHKPFATWEQDKLFSWLKSLVEKNGMQVTREALTMLTEISGVSLRALSNELEKIMTYLGDRKKIEVDDIKLLTSPGELISFELNDAVNNKEINRILNLINRMIKDGTSPILILGMLVAQVRLLLLLKEGFSQGENAQSMAATMRKSPYYIKKLSSGAQRYSFDELQNFYYGLQEADLKMKTGKLDQKLALELVVSNLYK